MGVKLRIPSTAARAVFERSNDNVRRLRASTGFASAAEGSLLLDILDRKGNGLKMTSLY